MLTFTRATEPSVSPTTRSRIGPRVRHGPHQGAQRSTTTGTWSERARTSCSKVASVTSTAVSGMAPIDVSGRRSDCCARPAVGFRTEEGPMEGIDEPGVTAWLEANVAGARGPFGFELIAGGRSNLTFKVTGADGTRYVLRRPPVSHVLPTAHDMQREHRIISALG